MLVRAELRLAVTLLAFGGTAGVAGGQQVSVLVVDAQSQTPVVAVQLTLGEAEQARATGNDGRARFTSLPMGKLTLVARRLGYAPLTRVLQLPRDSVVTIQLRASAMSLSAVTVQGAARSDATFQPTTVLDGAALDRALGTSIAATLAGEPGITQRTNGPVATAPIIRGLGGDRVLVLEDGLRLGDIATTAPDHAITADAISARRIEVIRGPAGLLYGSNTLGGVINVIREDVPRAPIDRVTGVMSLQGESVTTGVTGGGMAALPVGPLAVRVEGSWRDARSSQTPAGELPFTDQQQTDAGVGVSWAGSRGHIGSSVRRFTSEYGVPTSLGGLSLPGAHVGGIYVDLQRTSGRVDGEYRPRSGAVTSISGAANLVSFEQSELERGGFVGTRFGQLSSQGDLVMRYRRSGALAGQGAVGVFGQWRDMRAAGSFTGTRPAVLRAASVYGYDEMGFDRLRLMGGVRYDAVEIAPLERTPTQLLQDVRDRRFGNWSGSAAATYALPAGITVGTSVASAFRAPAIEELYSAGPHLASFAYEVGNPTLRAERGTGVDLFARVARQRLSAEASLFRNAVTDFIYYAPVQDPRTGLPLRDPRLRRYVVYQAAQAPALLQGAEGRVQVEPVTGWVGDATLSWVQGTRRDTRDPLPAMPPWRGRVQLRRETPRWLASVGADVIGAQTRIPPAPGGVSATCTVVRGGEAEADVLPAELCPTPGATLLNASVGLRRVIAARLHAITLVLDNVGDVLWRDHLWRAKQVAPQSGRNLRVLYRMTF